MLEYCFVFQLILVIRSEILLRIPLREQHSGWSQHKTSSLPGSWSCSGRSALSLHLVRTEALLEPLLSLAFTWHPYLHLLYKTLSAIWKQLELDLGKYVFFFLSFPIGFAAAYDIFKIQSLPWLLPTSCPALHWDNCLLTTHVLIYCVSHIKWNFNNLNLKCSIWITSSLCFGMCLQSTSLSNSVYIVKENL